MRSFNHLTETQERASPLRTDLAGTLPIARERCTRLVCGVRLPAPKPGMREPLRGSPAPMNASLNSIFFKVLSPLFSAEMPGQPAAPFGADRLTLVSVLVLVGHHRGDAERVPGDHDRLAARVQLRQELVRGAVDALVQHFGALVARHQLLDFGPERLGGLSAALTSGHRDDGVRVRQLLNLGRGDELQLPRVVSGAEQTTLELSVQLGDGSDDVHISLPCSAHTGVCALPKGRALTSWQQVRNLILHAPQSEAHPDSLRHQAGPKQGGKESRSIIATLARPC